jgi:hypothetical protein
MQLPKICSVSAAAILAAMTFAQAQTSEKAGQSSETGATSGKASESRSRSGTTSQKSGNAEPRQTEGKSAERGAAEDRSKQGERNKDAAQNTESRKSAQERGNERGKSDDGQKRESGLNGEKDNDTAAENSREGERGRTTEDRTSQTRGSGANTRVDINIRPEEKTKVHDIVVKDTGIRRYSRSDVKFDVHAGVRVPDQIVFYDPPAQLIQLVPDIRLYKIIVIDDEILVVDPRTREIVDVIEA